MEAPRTDQLLDPACPWYDLKSIRIPNVKWCEQQLCAWVEEPANAWSNLAYVFLGFLMIYLSRNLKSRVLRFYGWASLIVGVSSFAWHASNAFVFQIFDFFGMYVFCYLLILINVERLGKPAIKKSFGLYWVLVLGTTLATVVLDFTHIPIQGIVLGLILGIVTTEGLVWKQTQKLSSSLQSGTSPPYSLRHFFTSMVLMAVALVFSVSDHKRIFCDPNNHWIQGHAIWHVIGAVALLFSFFHHRQFDESL